MEYLDVWDLLENMDSLEFLVELALQEKLYVKYCTCQ
jgi:hypothetical protein